MRIPALNERATNASLLSYLNKLDHFRTYSYYHVLGLCSSQQLEPVSRVFEDVEQVQSLLTTPTPKDEAGNRAIQYVNGDTTSQSKFFVITNGVQDVDIVVTSLTIVNTISPGPVATGSQALIASAGEIVITEPLGVRFLNIFRQMCDELAVVASETRLIIKTIFVGEDDRGSTSYILDTPPLFAVLTDFKISITEAGSVYKGTIQNALNGIAYHPALTSSANGQLIRGDGSIKDALDSLARAYTEDASNNLKRLPAEIATKKLAVTYHIEIDESIKHIAGWTTKDMRNARQSSGNNGQPMVVPANVSFEGAIAYILEACAEYLKQAVSGTPDSFLYKIMARSETTLTDAKLVYTILPYKHNQHTEVGKRMQAATDPEEALTEADNVIVYDYTFTGKNTDIESLVMEIDEGLSFLQLVTEIHTLSDNYAKPPGVTVGATPTADVATADSSPLGERYASVSPGQNSTQQRSANQGLTALKESYDVAYERTMNQQAAKKACIIRTRGHTGWLAAFSINPYDMASSTKRDINTIPAVYLNILMPAAPSKQYPAQGMARAYERFWYKGLWRVLTVTSTFSDGSFNTELEMLAIPENSVTSKPLASAISGSPDTESKTESPTNVVVTPGAPFVMNSSNNKVSIATATNDTQITKDFKLGNFTVTRVVPTGRNQPPTQAILDNLVNLAGVLQYIKDRLNAPITITSGYRSDVVNKAVGGAANSDHKLGEAVDFTSTQLSPKQLVDAIIKLNIPYKQLILETPSSRSSWVHLSVSKTTAANKQVALRYTGTQYLPYTA